MKLILCGKGGCGKSTLATLLARSYAAEGRQVLVVDSDESNFGLHRQLGLPLPEDFTHYFGHKKAFMPTAPQTSSKAAGTSRTFRRSTPQRTATSASWPSERSTMPAKAVPAPWVP